MMQTKEMKLYFIARKKRMLAQAEYEQALLEEKMAKDIWQKSISKEKNHGVKTPN